MAHYTVCCLSDQAIPNLLFLKEMAQADSLHIFVSTLQMQEKCMATNLIEACQLKPERVIVLEVDSESIQDCKQKLEDYI